jgi:nitrogen fixation protein NifX
MQKQVGSLDIAFASSNETDLDEHFGSCHQLTIYRLTPDNSTYLESIKFTTEQGHNQQKISDRLAALTNCFAVYCLACGNPVRQQLLAQGTRVVIHPHNQNIDKLITQIQTNWPGKIALRQTKQRSKKEDSDYFNKLAESEWE